jgi:hypothetical protein
MIDFHPVIARLIDLGGELIAGGDEYEALRPALGEAMVLNETERRRFAMSFQSVARVPETERIAADIQKAFGERDKALRKVEAALETKSKEMISEGLADAQDLSLMLYQAGCALYGEDRKHHVTIFPTVQDFLQAGRNVEKGDELPEALSMRLPIMEYFISSFERAFRDDCEAHPRFERFADEMASSFVLFREGAALAVRGGADLPRGLSLIEEGALKAEGVNREIQKYVVELSGFSSITPVALLAERRKKYEAGELPIDAWQQAVQEVRRLVELHGASIEALRDAFAPAHVRQAFIEELEKYHRSEIEALETLDTEEPRIEKLKAGAEFFNDAYREACARLNETSVDLQSAPNILQLRAAARGVYAGRVPVRLLKSVVEALLHLIDTALEGDLSSAQSDALNLQREGLLHLELFPSTRDRDLLITGMQIVEEGTAMLLEEMKEQAAPSQQEAATCVPCVKCGESNAPGARHCARCGAWLAFAKGSSQGAVHSFGEGESPK